MATTSVWGRSMNDIRLLGVDGKVVPGSITAPNKGREETSEVVHGERNRVDLADNVGETPNHKLVTIVIQSGTDDRTSEESKGVTIATEELGAVVGISQDLGTTGIGNAGTESAEDEGRFGRVRKSNTGVVQGLAGLAPRQGELAVRHWRKGYSRTWVLGRGEKWGCGFSK